jgi:hypothetical protein
MKEATGELNMTVITIVAIAALAAFFYLVIWPNIQNSMALNQACNASDQGTTVYSDTINKKKIYCDGKGKCTYGTASRTCKSSNQGK